MTDNVVASGLHLVHVSKSKPHEQSTRGGQMHSPKRQGQIVDVGFLRRLQLRAKLNASCLFLNVNQIMSATSWTRYNECGRPVWNTKNTVSALQWGVQRRHERNRSKVYEAVGQILCGSLKKNRINCSLQAWGYVVSLKLKTLQSINIRTYSKTKTKYLQANRLPGSIPLTRRIRQTPLVQRVVNRWLCRHHCSETISGHQPQQDARRFSFVRLHKSRHVFRSVSPSGRR